ncbi:molybdopterin converting factor subunit 1 [Microscilla marina]|uniref:Molybdopterin synthase sulfur carrier subunit n=1 Tax=Microscilla marina ATCC 23134 TaxID=313606 RepID=A1ZKS7_MICM2|nr:molybdopterin converting factor subunit 1 [Microscilla marina]EAY28893.1 molybdopterin converting factor, subunit 1 [Microscilla marina ATCC 23134]
MKLNILLFGIARDIVGGASLALEVEEKTTVEALIVHLHKVYPDFDRLTSLMIAVNSDYAKGEVVLKENDEIALIPPVSGG